MNARWDSKGTARALLVRKEEPWSAYHALKESVGLCGGEASVARESVSGRSAAASLHVQVRIKRWVMGRNLCEEINMDHGSGSDQKN